MQYLDRLQAEQRRLETKASRITAEITWAEERLAEVRAEAAVAQADVDHVMVLEQAVDVRDKAAEVLWAAIRSALDEGVTQTDITEVTGIARSTIRRQLSDGDAAGASRTPLWDRPLPGMGDVDQAAGSEHSTAEDPAASPDGVDAPAALGPNDVRCPASRGVDQCRLPDGHYHADGRQHDYEVLTYVPLFGRDLTAAEAAAEGYRQLVGPVDHRTAGGFDRKGPHRWSCNCGEGGIAANKVQASKAMQAHRLSHAGDPAGV